MGPTRVRPRLQILLALGTLSCEAVPRGPGSLAITATSTLAEPMVFNYEVAVDGGSPRMLAGGGSDSWRVHGLAPGRHVVSVRGTIPTVCAGTGDREVNVAGDDTVSVAIELQCGRITGDLQVSVTTPASAGVSTFGLLVNGVPRGNVLANGTTMVRVSPGQVLVDLLVGGSVAPNCTRPATQTVTVSRGATTIVNFAPSCTPLAFIRLAHSVTGVDRDPDGVIVRLATSEAVRVTTTNVRGLPSGSVTYTVQDVQPNCTLPISATGSINGIAGDTVTLALSLTCSAIPSGPVAFTATDPADDTLPNPLRTATRVHDIRSLSGRYAPGWLVLTFRFSQPVAFANSPDVGARLIGVVDLDTDEDAATGPPPLANQFGANADQGLEHTILLPFGDSASAPIASSPVGVSIGTPRVPVRYGGDSVMVFLPLEKLADDGHMTITSIFGTADRPTDYVPNSGVVRARRSSVLVGDAVRMGSRAAGRRGMDPRHPIDTLWRR